jgi:hypothetical protein
MLSLIWENIFVKKGTREMSKKILAALLTITIPIWYIPVGFCLIFSFIFMGAYEGILEALNGKAQEK